MNGQTEDDPQKTLPKITAGIMLMGYGAGDWGGVVGFSCLYWTGFSFVVIFFCLNYGTVQVILWISAQWSPSFRMFCALKP